MQNRQTGSLSRRPCPHRYVHVNFPNIVVGCAGLVCTGGYDGIIKGWDPRQGGNGASLAPVFTMDTPEAVSRRAIHEIDTIVSAGPLGGEFSGQILTCV
jgi:hypothetical protein